MKRTGRTKYVVITVIAFLLIALRLALPTLIREQANKKLAALPDYKAHLGGVHLAIWRGAVALRDIELIHAGRDTAINIKNFEVSAKWAQIFRKAFVGNLLVQKPVLKMVVARPTKAIDKAKEKGKEAEKDVEEKTGKTIPEILLDLIPFRIDRFELENGELTLRESNEHADDKDRAPTQKPLITDLHIVVTNLTNSSHLSESLVATAHVTGRVSGSGLIDLKLKIDPTADQPRFDMTTEIEKFELANLNEFLEWQTGLHFEKGTFQLYSEASAAHGGFKGYIKPLIEDLKAGTPGKQGIVQKAKKAMINVTAKIFENKKTDEVATRVPFEGRFDNPSANVWEAVFALLRNAFIEAIKPGLDPKEMS